MEIRKPCTKNFRGHVSAADGRPALFQGREVAVRGTVPAYRAPGIDPIAVLHVRGAAFSAKVKAATTNLWAWLQHWRRARRPHYRFDYATTGDGFVAARQVLAVVKKLDQPVSRVCHCFDSCAGNQKRSLPQGRGKTDRRCRGLAAIARAEQRQGVAGADRASFRHRTGDPSHRLKETTQI